MFKEIIFIFILCISFLETNKMFRKIYTSVSQLFIFVLCELLKGLKVNQSWWIDPSLVSVGSLWSYNQLAKFIMVYGNWETVGLALKRWQSHLPAPLKLCFCAVSYHPTTEERLCSLCETPQFTLRTPQKKNPTNSHLSNISDNHRETTNLLAEGPVCSCRLKVQFMPVNLPNC